MRKRSDKTEIRRLRWVLKCALGCILALHPDSPRDTGDRRWSADTSKEG